MVYGQWMHCSRQINQQFAVFEKLVGVSFYPENVIQSDKERKLSKKLNMSAILKTVQKTRVKAINMINWKWLEKRQTENTVKSPR